MSLRGYTAKVLGLLFVSIALGYGGCAVAQEGKGIRFWNLTLHTITQLRMSPAGENSWGPDQCQNDRDGTVASFGQEQAAHAAPSAIHCKKGIYASLRRIRPEALPMPLRRG